MFESINGTLAAEDLTYFFVYANQVTGGFFVLFMVIAFFLIIFISSIVMQLRFTSRIRPDISTLASSFATLGFALILEQRTGLLLAYQFYIIIALTVLSLLWVIFSE